MSSLFISCVSSDFENDGARFPGFRSALARYLRRADCTVNVQEDFRQEGACDTVEKLAGYIKNCKAVVHLLGPKLGGVADEKARFAFFSNRDFLEGKEFLADYPELKEELGDCANLTYTQWEAFLALYFGIPLFVYATKDAKASQKSHLDRLLLARKYAESFQCDIDLRGKLIEQHHFHRRLPELHDAEATAWAW